MEEKREEKIQEEKEHEKEKAKEKGDCTVEKKQLKYQLAKNKLKILA